LPAGSPSAITFSSQYGICTEALLAALQQAGWRLTTNGPDAQIFGSPGFSGDPHERVRRESQPRPLNRPQPRWLKGNDTGRVGQHSISWAGEQSCVARQTLPLSMSGRCPGTTSTAASSRKRRDSTTWASWVKTTSWWTLITRIRTPLGRVHQRCWQTG
jgi:hypothetical protein